MTRNLRIFIGVTTVLTILYLAANDLVDHLSGGAQTLASWILLILALWVAFDLILKIIYRLAGITKKLMDPFPARLTHQQAAIVNKYWIAWLGSSLPTAFVYTLLFQRNQWKSALLTGGVIIVVVVLAVMNSKQKIAGHTKDQIFK